MSYPGLTFALMIGVAIGTAIYYYFNSENNNRNKYEHQMPPSNPTVSGYDTGRPKNKKRGNSSTSHCSICFEQLKPTTSRRISCGHIFHDECIKKWFQIGSTNTCPNCRAQL